MDDTISRQAAIETVRKAKSIGQAHRMLIQLPSATDTNVGGNLSVDELIKILNPESNYVFYDDAHGFCINTRDVLEHLCAMPPAQPESCEYYALCRHGRDENKLRARLGFCEYCNEDADGYVKPIEKNCHAFIRFGMNGWELSLKANGWHGSAKIRYCPMCGRDLLVK